MSQKLYKGQTLVSHEPVAQVYLDHIKALEKKIQDLQHEFTIQNEYQRLIINFPLIKSEK